MTEALSLHSAAFGVLEPLLRAAPGTELSADLADAIDSCALVAREQDLRSVGYLSAILAPYLRKHGLQSQTPRGRELLQLWVNDFLAFCAGKIPRDKVRSLVDQLTAWPALAPLPAAFAEMIVERLELDAAHISRQSEPSLPLVGPSDSAEVLELGRDELDLLADEAAILQAKALPVLLSEQAGAQSNGRAISFVEDYAVDLDLIGNALEYVGLGVLADALVSVADDLRKHALRSSNLADSLHRSLVELPPALQAYFRDPADATARELTSVLCHWLGEPGRSIAASLARVSIVARRKLPSLTEPVGFEQLSIAVPQEADATVLAQLKREMPRLCEAFAESISQVRAGRTDKLADAQRIAHTLKGAANTVGIRGVASLTHQLEDLLQILRSSAQSAPAGLLDLLGRAADTLSDLNEALLGLAPEPSDLGDVLQALVSWINRFQVEGVGGQSNAQLGAEPLAAQVELPPAEAAPQLEPSESLLAAAAVEPEILDQETLQVPVATVERMLEAISNASIKLAQMQAHIGQIDTTRLSLQTSGEGLQRISVELERLVDARGIAKLPASAEQADFDPLELEQYDDFHTVARRIAEAGADQRVLDRNLDEHVSELKALSDEIERLQFDLRELVQRTRLVPVQNIVARLNRAVRQAARMSEKQVRLEIQGEQTALDGDVLLLLVDSLTHLLRNAVDHGIESPPVRTANKKEPEGVIRLSFERDSSAVRIVCADDGAGINLNAVYARALELGLVTGVTSADDQAVLQHIFAPGFSTRQAVTQLSGRGIGLDVVNQTVHKLRGQISVDSQPGSGARFLLSIPVTMANQPVMVMHDARYCLALAAHDIDEILLVRALSHDEAGSPIALTEKGAVPLRYLSDLLGLPAQAFAADAAQFMVLVVRLASGGRFGVLTPPLSHARNVEVRALPSWVARGPGVLGLAVLGEGSIAPVIDLPQLLSAPSQPDDRHTRSATFEENTLPVCLLVDDSVSVRRSMELFLKDLGLQVVSASDGVQALDRARRTPPALVIADLEMPRMNGLEFVRALRAQSQFAATPIIMITSRFSQKHRASALQAGVNVFLTKPYTEDSIASEIARCLARKLS